MVFFWSIWALLIINTRFNVRNCIFNSRTIFKLSSVWFALNICEFITIFGLIYAKKQRIWLLKLYILDTTIALKLFLTIINFIWFILFTLHSPCGHVYQTRYFQKKSIDNIDKIIKWMQYYDIQVIGLIHAWTSVISFISAMLLAIKRNDIKMYVLWHMDKLSEYIQDRQIY